MTSTNATTKDLADKVYQRIQGAKVNSTLPNLSVLNKLFENLFYASIKTEEGDHIRVTVTLIDSKNPDPDPPERIVKDRWSYVPFAEPLEFSVKNIVKLSKAADPWSSSFAIDFNEKDELFIWGLIDQAVHYQGFLHYEVEEGPEQPGIFQTSITGIGSLVVIFEYQLIATLRQNSLISNYIDVFNRGPVFEILKNYSENYRKDVYKFIKDTFPDKNIQASWEQFINKSWVQVISRLLIKIQSYGHGGAILITDQFQNDLDIKHKINYERLAQAILNLTTLTIAQSQYSNLIMDKYLEKGNDVPVDPFLDEALSNFEKIERKDEVKGALRFVASLSCIDGLILLDNLLQIRGFGVVVNNIDLPKYVYLSKTASISQDRMLKMNPNSFGTRHRSMFSYCFKNEGSLGFVVSQDGDIRVITCKFR